MKTTPSFPPHSPSLRSLSLLLVPLCLHVDTELAFPLKTSYTRGCCYLPCGQSFVKLYFDFFVLWLLHVRTEEDSSKVNRVDFFFLSLSLALSSSTIRPPSGFFFLFFFFFANVAVSDFLELCEKKKKKRRRKKKETSFSVVTPYSSVLFGWPRLTVTSLWPVTELVSC